MSLRDELVRYTKESEYPVIVSEMIKRAKQGSSEIIINMSELDYDTINILEDEGLVITEYDNGKIKIYWGHYLFD